MGGMQGRIRGDRGAFKFPTVPQRARQRWATRAEVESPAALGTDASTRGYTDVKMGETLDEGSAVVGSMSRRWVVLKLGAAGFLFAMAAGTCLAFVISSPLIGSVGHFLAPYLKLHFPPRTIAQAGVVLLAFVCLALFKGIPGRMWRSLRLGLMPVRDWMCGLPLVVAFWMLLGSRRPLLAWTSLALGAVLTIAAGALLRGSSKTGKGLSRFLESDLPVPEDGEDLLGRGDRIKALVSTIVLEQPAIIAVTGAYGKGKTSFLNLTMGELRKLEGTDLPVIVRFNPWLAADSNALVLSLLNSVVAEIKHSFVVPGLGRDAARFARMLLSAIPRTEKLKEFVAEPSQEDRIDGLADQIAKIPRRVLVVLDDIDRMEAKEVETVFKILRGSVRLSNITFLCSFDRAEVALILKATRPQQDTDRFIEKFFPIQFPLPEVDPSEFRDLLSQKISAVAERYGAPSGAELSKPLDNIWEGGADLYFDSLRRIKLFLNRINHSLERVASEVNIEDFIRLELIRDIQPSLYEQIYRNPEFFYNGDFAFETRFRRLGSLDEKEREEERAKFYEGLKATVPEDRQYVFRLLDGLFPRFGSYRKVFGADAVGVVEAERAKRIYHPRCFRQYFLLRVPSELFGRKEFTAFADSLHRLSEEDAARAFGAVFKSIVNEDFKRWHFVHQVEGELENLSLSVSCGLCRGMAQNSADWQGDAFELLIAISSTRETLRKIADSGERRRFLRAIVCESASDLYTLMLLRRLEHDLKSPLEEGEQFRVVGFRREGADTAAALLSDLQEIKVFAAEHVRARYLGPDAPSVFEQFGRLGSGVNRIEPNAFLFNWQNLGPSSQAHAREYLRSLFSRRPQDLNEFLKLMFRVEFIDDYTQLKPLIDYGELSELIAQNECSLDPEKVSQFRGRLQAEQQARPA
jgi:hypothetical protein